MKQFVVTLTAFSVSDYTRATAHTFLTNEHWFFYLVPTVHLGDRICAHIYDYMHRNYAEVLNYIGMSSSWLQACVCASVSVCWGASVGVGCKQSRSHLKTISAPVRHSTYMPRWW